MLLDECDLSNVEILLNVNIKEISNSRPFKIKSDQGEFTASNVVVASGGLSIPTLGGATGFGYQLAKQFSIKVNQQFASLVPFTLTGKWHDLSQKLSGVSIPVIVSVQAKDFSENMLFTHRGLSGPVILQISNYWNLGDTIAINLLPSIDL